MYLKRYNQAKNLSKGDILFWLLDMSIICEHVLRLEIRKTFKLWVYLTMLQVYREACVHACLNLNIVLISFLTGKCAIQNNKKTYAIQVYGHVDKLWTYQGAKIKNDEFGLIVPLYDSFAKNPHRCDSQRSFTIGLFSYMA